MSSGVANNMAFDAFCRFLEGVSNMRRKKDKLESLWGYLRPVMHDDLWPLFRLLLPAADRHRGNYELKENKLAKLVSAVLGLPEKEKKRLLGYRDASLQEGFKYAVPGDFGSVLHSVVDLRVSGSGQGLTVGAVNAMLDQLSVEHDKLEAKAHLEKDGAAFLTSGADEQVNFRVLATTINKMSALEIKWLSRIILKDTRCGLSIESILRQLHKHAMELFEEIADLKTVLSRLKSTGGVKPSSGQGEFSVNFLFQPVRPMLAGRLGVESCGKVLFKNKHLLKKPPELVAAAIQDKYSENGDPNAASSGTANASSSTALVPVPENDAIVPTETPLVEDSYFVETKLDGERMVCHIDKSKGLLSLFTRNGNDYTARYGPQMKETILSCVGAEQCILDGEIMAYDEALASFLPFGSNRNCSLDNSGKTHLCYMIFDVLMFKSKKSETVFEFRQNKLQARKNVLNNIIRPRKNWVEIVEARGPYTKPDEIENELLGAINRREEGIMVKHSDSKYVFNSRKSGWYKIKPEYGAKFADHLDLVVVGGYFADTDTRRRGGTGLADNISKFLLALRVSKDTEQGVAGQIVGAITIDNEGENGEKKDEKDLEYDEIKRNIALKEKEKFKADARKDELAEDSRFDRTAITFAKVGTGYTNKELSDICEVLRPNLVRYDSKNPPSWLTFKFPSLTRPDVIISGLEHASIVFEVEAAEVIPSSDFEMGYTLRFPRCVQWRQDKNYEDSMSLGELQTFMSAERENQRFSLAVGAKRRLENQGILPNRDNDDDILDENGGLLTAAKRRRNFNNMGKASGPGSRGGGKIGLKSRRVQPSVIGKVVAGSGNGANGGNGGANSSILAEINQSINESPEDSGGISNNTSSTDGKNFSGIPKPTPLNTIVGDFLASEMTMNIFEGLEIYVSNCHNPNTMENQMTSTSKAAAAVPLTTKPVLETVLSRCGASVVAQYRPGKTQIVIANHADLRVKNIFNRYGCDLLKCEYILECISAERKIDPPRPRHYLVMSEGSKGRIREEFDEYGDSYFEDIDVEEWGRLDVGKKDVNQENSVFNAECAVWMNKLLAEE